MVKKSAGVRVGSRGSRKKGQRFALGEGSPFTAAKKGAEIRAYVAGEHAIDIALQMAAVWKRRCCPTHTEQALTAFYLAVFEWTEEMRRDNVDMNIFITRLRQSGVRVPCSAVESDDNSESVAPGVN